MKTLKAVVAKYNQTSLILRILIGLAVGGCSQNRKTVFFMSTVFGAVLQKLTKNTGSGCKMPDNTTSFSPYML